MSTKTLTERVVMLLADIERADKELDNDDPYRYVVWGIKQTAEQALDAGVRTASEALYNIERLKQARKEAKA